MSANEMVPSTNNISAVGEFRVVVKTSNLDVASSGSSTLSVDSKGKAHSRRLSLDVPDETHSWPKTVAGERRLEDVEFDDVDGMTDLSMTPRQTSSCYDGEANQPYAREKTYVNPFFNFMRRYRQLPVNQGKKVVELSVEGGQLWRTMSSDEKKPFREDALLESKRRRDRKLNCAREFGREFRRRGLKHSCLICTDK